MSLNEYVTPLPWCVSTHKNSHNKILWKKTRHLIAKTYREADAAFIVRAVNSHEALKALAEEIAERADYVSRRGPDSKSAEGDWISAGWLEDVGEKAHAALAIAKGETT